MASRLNQIAEDRLLAQLLACFRSMRSFHQREAFARRVAPGSGLLAYLKDALGDLLRFLRVERRPPLAGT